MIDTHTHLYMTEFDVEGQQPGSFEGQQAAVRRALDAGVNLMMMPNVDRDSVEPLKALNRLCPDTTIMAMGLHPTEVKDSWKDDLDFIMAELDNNTSSYKAIGEAGIDLYWDKKFQEQQMQVFDLQLYKAEQYSLPVIIHCREGLDQTLEVLSGHPTVCTVFHSFGGTMADVDRIRRYGDYFFGINGIVTFKNSKLREVLPHITAERMLTETDSPFLAPTPLRGSRNESANIPLILKTMAEALNISSGEMDSLTTTNAKRLFKI